jgi:hypothetical protein
MDSNQELTQTASLLDAMADRLACAADELRMAAGEEEAAALAEPPEPYVDWTDKMLFERQAREELALLIRGIEGPNPPPAPRRQGPEG